MLGITGGFWVLVMAVELGLAGLVHAEPRIQTVLRYAGGLGALAAYTTVGGDVLWETLVIAAVLAGACFGSVVIWAGFGAALRRLLSNPRTRTAFNRSMAGLLVFPWCRCSGKGGWSRIQSALEFLSKQRVSGSFA
jgi:threonine/homoserine/homoserine lactone efflux protein